MGKLYGSHQDYFAATGGAVEKTTIVRGYTRRWLLECGYERNAVEAFLESSAWREFYYWVGAGYTEASEAEFCEEVGAQLENRFLAWRNESQRGAHTPRWSPMINISGASSAWKTLLLPIPTSWLPETQQGEAERYLHYLQNKLRTGVDAFLNALSLAFSGDSGIRSLLSMLETSSCVNRYPYVREAVKPEQSKHTGGANREYVQLLGYQFSGEASEAEFFVQIAHLYPSCFSEIYAQIGILTEWRGLICCSNTQQGSHCCEGTVYLLDEAACGQCHSCRIMIELTDLSQSIWRVLGYWTYAEVFGFVLQGAPLPSRVGYALFRSPFIVNHSSATQNFEFQQGVFRRLIPELELPYSGGWELKLLPCLAAKSVAAIYKRLAPKLEARSWALRLHASESIRSAALRKNENSRTSAPRWDARLQAGAVEKLLADWNSLAPAEWRYTTSSMREDFRRALLRARRVIDG